MAEELRTRGTPIWRGNFLTNVEVQATEVNETGEGVRLRVKAKYARGDAPGQFFVGEHTMLISRKGFIEVSYDYKPLNCDGALLEAGMSFLAPAEASELHWIGQGPFAGFPGKDRLNDFGIYHLNSRDIRFQGNRRAVDWRCWLVHRAWAWRWGVTNWISLWKTPFRELY